MKDLITLADVAREHGVPYEEARRRLRRAGVRMTRRERFERGSPRHRRVLGALVGESPSVVITQRPAK